MVPALLKARFLIRVYILVYVVRARHVLPATVPLGNEISSKEDNCLVDNELYINGEELYNGTESIPPENTGLATEVLENSTMLENVTANLEKQVVPSHNVSAVRDNSIVVPRKKPKRVPRIPIDVQLSKEEMDALEKVQAVSRSLHVQEVRLFRKLYKKLYADCMLKNTLTCFKLSFLTSLKDFVDPEADIRVHGNSESAEAEFREDNNHEADDREVNKDSEESSTENTEVSEQYVDPLTWGLSTLKDIVVRFVLNIFLDFFQDKESDSVEPRHYNDVDYESSSSEESEEYDDEDYDSDEDNRDDRTMKNPEFSNGIVTGTVLVILKIVVLAKIKMLAVLLFQKMLMFGAMSLGMMGANFMMKKLTGGFFAGKGVEGASAAHTTGYGYGGSGLGSLLGDMMMHHMSYHHHNDLGGADSMTMPMFALPHAALGQRRFYLEPNGYIIDKPRKSNRRVSKLSAQPAFVKRRFVPVLLGLKK